MTHREPKLSLPLRITAAGCIALWLVSVSACSLKVLLCCESRDSETVAHADHEHSHDTKDTVADMNLAHDADAHDPQDADGHSSDSNRRNSTEGSCCSTLKAAILSANPVVFGKLALHPIPFVCVLHQTHGTLLARSETPPNCQAKDRDWVFTPQVCFGVAHRSLAPPSLA